MKCIKTRVQVSLALLASLAAARARPATNWNDWANNADEAFRRAARLVPESFDVRDSTFGCGGTITDQAQCGSCWAVSAASTLSDRYCIHSGQFAAGGRASIALSPQPLISCASASNNAPESPYQSQGCNGGYQEEAWRFLTQNGTSKMTADQQGGCSPLLSKNCSPDPDGNGCITCAFADACLDTGEAPRRYTVAASGLIQGSEENMDAQVLAVQKELMQNGPVHACFEVFTNFFDFFDENPTGVYNSTTGAEFAGGHCVKIIGWGKTAGVPFWLIANSWGTGWAQQGVFRYVRGLDLGGMDSSVWAACPADTSCALTPAVKPPPPNDDPAHATRRASGGMWHPVPVTHTHVERAWRAAKRDVSDWVRHRRHNEAPRLMQILASDEATAPTALCAVHTQVVNGLRVRLVFDAGGDAPLVVTTHVAATSATGEYTLERMHVGAPSLCDQAAGAAPKFSLDLSEPSLMSPL